MNTTNICSTAIQESTNSRIHTILSKLSKVRETPNGWSALCPAHPDQKPSLDIAVKDGHILMHCKAGCSTEDIVRQIGLDMKDLFPDAMRRSKGDFNRKIERVYDYTDEMGELICQRVRTNPKGFYWRRPNGNGGFINKLDGARRVLYNLQAVLEAIEKDENVYLPEGEKDCETLIKRGFVATTEGSICDKWLDSYTDVLKGGNVILLGDNHDDGRKRIARLSRILSGVTNLKVIEQLPELTKEKGDITDWFNDGHNEEEFLSLVELTPVHTLDDSSGSNKELIQTDFKLTDLGNAERLIASCKGEIRHNVDTKQWIIWDKNRWVPDYTGEMHARCKDVVRGMYGQLPYLSESERKDSLKHMTKSESVSRLKAMLNLAEQERGIPIREIELDLNPILFNCQNGTLDLETGRLYEPKHDDLITRLSSVPYIPDAKCPRWIQFLNEVFPGDYEIQDYIHRVIGYSLTGLTREQCFFVLHGNGSNGKSILVRIMQHILGDLAKMTPFTTFLERRDTSNTSDLAGLVNVRFVGATECDANQYLNESLIKLLTGEDTVTCRNMYRSFFGYRPHFKIFMLANGIPNLRSQAYAMKRRMKPIPFYVRFHDEHEKQFPVMDKQLFPKLIAERDGILAWAVDGCKKWQEFGLQEPAIIREQVEDHFYSCDTLSEFLESICVFAPDRKVGSTELWNRYIHWCQERKLKSEFNSIKGFVKNLLSRDGITKGKQNTKERSTRRLLKGIGVKDD